MIKKSPKKAQRFLANFDIPVDSSSLFVGIEFNDDKGIRRRKKSKSCNTLEEAFQVILIEKAQLLAKGATNIEVSLCDASEVSEDDIESWETIDVMK